MSEPLLLRPPFPYFGGKRRVASLVWQRFGNVPNYVEPFAGSLAVLLARPDAFPPRVETCNDVDLYIANFWRALKADPDAVASFADYPVNEADLHARHLWLLTQARANVARVKADPDFYDAKVAGWWVWGLCLWIGSGWCVTPSWTGRRARGIHTRNGDTSQQQPHRTGDPGVHLPPQKIPQCDRGGRGIVGSSIDKEFGGLPQKRSGGHVPSLSQQNPGLYVYLNALAWRLRRVRVCCGDWSRVLTPSVTTRIGATAVFLDPPYQHSERTICYAEDHNVSADVRAWAIANGDNPAFRIALCGYEGEHAMPDTWETVAWKAHGGYSRSERGVKNRSRERIWFSPFCLRPSDRLNFGDESQDGRRRRGSGSSGQVRRLPETEVS